MIMSKIIYLTAAFHIEDGMLMGTRNVYGYIIKNNKLILIYKDILKNNTNLLSEIRMMLFKETYKDENSFNYNNGSIGYNINN